MTADAPGRATSRNQHQPNRKECKMIDFILDAIIDYIKNGDEK